MPDHYQLTAFSDVSSRIMRRAWEHLDNPPVLVRFARAAIHRIGNMDRLFGERIGVRDDASDTLLRDASRRRRLLEAVAHELAGCINPATRRDVQLADVARTDDFAWLMLNYLERESDPSGMPWLDAADHVFRPNSVEDVDALLSAASASETVRVRMAEWIEPVILGSDRARYQKERHAMFSSPQRREASPVRHAPVQVLANNWLARAEQGDPVAWWCLNRDLTLSEDSDLCGDEHEGDLTQVAGWGAIDDATKERCIRAALSYIQTGDPENSEWLGKESILYRPSAAGYRALRLLVGARPDLLGELSSEHWGRWAASILAFWVGAKGFAEAAALSARAYAAAPEPTFAALAVLLRKEARQGYCNVLDRLRDVWSPELARRILGLLSDPAFSAQAVGAALAKVLKAAPGEGTAAALQLLEAREGGPELSARASRAIVALLRERPGASWTTVWPSLEADVAFGYGVVETLASEFHMGEPLRLLSELDETSLATLYIWLRARVADDRSLEGGAVTPRESAIRLRDSIIEVLKQRGTPGAVTELQRIAAAFPEQPWLQFSIIGAEEARLRAGWQGLPLEALRRLLEDSDARVLATDDQLLDLLLESLGRFQRLLQGETPVVANLWNDKPSEPKDELHLSDNIKQFLEGDLRGRVIANREPELRRSDKTDIRVDAFATSGTRKLSVVVEVKGCWNPNVKTEMKDQLRDRYLHNSGLTKGLYVVGWFLCDAWDVEYRKESTPRWTFEEARSFFAFQAEQLSENGFSLAACVLDARRAGPRKRAGKPAKARRKPRKRGGSQG